MRPSSIIKTQHFTIKVFHNEEFSPIQLLLLLSFCVQWDLDAATTWLVKRAVDVLAPVIAATCNASLQSGFFPQLQKQARVTARLKKPSMDPDDLNSFRPTSNLTFLSKIMEHVVTKQFSSHATLSGRSFP